MKRIFSCTLSFFILFFVACESHTNQPGYEIKILTDMIYPVPYESHSKNPVFKDGLTLQNPVEGTIYRGSILIETADGNPVPLSEKALARGEHIFKSYCMVCHGVKGEGDGPLIPKFPNPPDFNSKRLKELTDEEIYQIIMKGKNTMPSHAGQIDGLDRWKLVHYIKKLQGR